MKQGEGPPKGAKEQVLKVAGSNPRPTNREISEAVQRKFGETTKLSPRTIGRYCKAAGLPTSSRQGKAKGRLLNEDPAQAERSGHWPGLRNIARAVQEQLTAPLPQLLGLTQWHDDQKPGWHNQDLIVGVGNKISLQVEQDVLFGALKEHVPGSSAWELLEKWERNVGHMTTGLEQVCIWVKAHPELEGRQWISSEELAQDGLGLLLQFVQTVVLNAVEDAIGNTWTRQSYPLRRVATGGRRRNLCWERLPISYVLACSEDSEESAGLRASHEKLRKDLQEQKPLRDTVALWQQTQEVHRRLCDELKRLSLLATFPGVCSLWQGQALQPGG